MDDVLAARVPTPWRRLSWDSAALGSWFSHLLERDNQLRSWIYEGRPNVLWLAGFFSPQGLLTALRQAVSHEGCSFHAVSLHSEVLKLMREEITRSPADGVYIHGLFLDGAGWDRKRRRLVESTPKVLYTQLPVVHLFASKAPVVEDPRSYPCPVYKTPIRRDLTYVTEIRLRSLQPAEHWILRGTALLCSIK